MNRIRLSLLVGLLLGVSIPSHAQLGIESIFKDIDDVGFYFGCWDTSSDAVEASGECPSGNRDYGVEASFKLKDITLGPSSRRDTLVLRTVVVSNHRRDTTYHYDPKKEVEPGQPFISLELGLGYSQFTGFQSANPTLDLRGAVREIPAVSLYGSFHYTRKSKLIPYLGVRSGLIQLRDVQAFTPLTGTDTTVVFSGEAQSFQLGIVGGLTLRFRRIGFFGEWAWIDREFESVRWAAPGTNRAPASLPRRMDFSGRSFSAGIQINIRDR